MSRRRQGRPLLIMPAYRGWWLTDVDEQMPASWYEKIDDAVADAREYLNHRGGGMIVIREDEEVASGATPAPDRNDREAGAA